MLIANFSLGSAQMQVLLAFRFHPDTRTAGDDRHPMHDVDHTVVILRKLCREGLLLWHAGDRTNEKPPGYSLTPKGETLLALVEGELRRTLAWFEGKPLPGSSVNGGDHDVATGKAEYNRFGRIRPKKKIA